MQEISIEKGNSLIDAELHEVTCDWCGKKQKMNQRPIGYVLPLEWGYIYPTLVMSAHHFCPDCWETIKPKEKK